MILMREAFWNIGDVRGLVHLLMIIPLSALMYGLFRHFRLWCLGNKIETIAHPLKRVLSLLTYAFAHRRTLRDRYAGLMHIFIFGGFLLLFLGTVVIFFEDTFGMKLLQGKRFEFYELTLDFAGLFMFVGVLMGIYRRYFLKPSHLKTKREDGLVYFILLFIIASGFIIEGLRISLITEQKSFWSPIGYALGSIFQSIPEGSRLVLHRLMWWLHLCVSFFLIGYIPFSKLLHMFTAPLNIFFNSCATTSKMAVIDLNTQRYGVNQLKDFNWNELLSFDACTECGRCQSVCPSHLSGGPLNPRTFILNLQKRMRAELKKQPNRTPPEGLIEDCVTEGEIWACNTCLACVKECPIFIDPMHRLSDFRHHLILTDSKIPPELERVYRNLEWIGDPYGAGNLIRDELSKSHIIKKNGPYDPDDLLFWVGCQSYFNERNRKTVDSIFRIFEKFNIRFNVLGREEPCCGDIARRTGNEYLFRKIAEKTIQVLEQKEIKKIVTACPHCYHVLKNEYKELGGRFEVFYYIELLEDIFRNKPPVFEKVGIGKVTFHDPCYLSRYNGIVSAPREFLHMIPGISIQEMEQSKVNSFCCGGGGGGMFLGGQLKNRNSEVRIKQAIATTADYLLTACPYCLIMLDDAAKNLPPEESSVRVIDIAEALSGALTC